MQKCFTAMLTIIIATLFVHPIAAQVTQFECYITVSDTTPTWVDWQMASQEGELPAGEVYRIVGQYNNAYQIQLDETATTWILAIYEPFGEQCNETPGIGWVGHGSNFIDNLYPDPTLEPICLFVATEVSPTFQTSQMQRFVEHPFGTLEMSHTYDVLNWTMNAVFLRFENTMTFGWAGIDVGSLRCDSTPNPIAPDSASVTINTRLWSKPDVFAGHWFVEVPTGAWVQILRGPIVGRIRYDEDIDGNWYQVQYNTQVGWVWEGRLIFPQ